MTKKEEQIEINIRLLDTKLIHDVLKHLASAEGEQIPNVEDINKIAKHCMEKAFESEDGYFEIGGFEAEVKEGAVEIRYVIAKANPFQELLS
jgi:hypothetical protein